MNIPYGISDYKRTIDMKIYFISFLLFLFPQIAFSNLIQDMDRFNHLTVQDGLASQYVIDIHQDQKGFIWICTSNGLARYDGHRFKVYRNEPDNPNSLSHSTVNSIVETKEGVFWVATINGLNRLDPRTETIQRFLVDKRQHRIPKIILSDADILWVATRYQGLICFNTKTFDYHYIQHDPNKPHTLSSNTIQTLYIDHLNYLWIGTIKGLDRYDPTTQTFLNYKGDPNDKNSLFSSPVTAIHEDSDGTLWVGTDGRIQQFNRQLNQFKTIYPDQQHSQINVRFIDSDRQHHIWVGSSHDGVWMFDRNPSQWKHFTHDNTPYSLSENSLLCFLQDRSGTYWFGFTGKGISLLYPKHKKIGWLTHKPDDINSIAGDAITGMIEDQQGKIWLSINGFGLDCLDLATNKIVHYKANKDHPEQLISPTVVSLLEDHQHQIWVGTWGAGLECLNPKTGIFTHYQHDPNNPDSISANLITDIYEDDLHTLWIATWGGGLNRWDFKTQHFQHYRNDPDNPDSIRDNRIIDIYEDSHKTLWLALIGGGAARFDRATEKFIHFSHDNDLLSKTTIHCFYEDQHRHFWLGTISRGLLRLDRETEAVQCYSTQEGLPSNLVSGILEDDTGNLWISTDNGLACLNPTTEKIVNYDRHDGLTSPFFSCAPH
jgi:ligand-binding sensor domain-containing protein